MILSRVNVMLDETDLLTKIACQDRAAMASVYDCFSDELMAIAYNLCHNRELAEDVLHDVFVAFYRRVGSNDGFKLSGSLRAYLAVSVVNRVRKIVSSKHYSVVKGYDGDRVDDNGQKGDDKIISAELYQRLDVALATLPLEQREVICLRGQGDMTFKEISNALGVSINTVQSRYRYGLNKLRILMGKEYQHD